MLPNCLPTEQVANLGEISPISQGVGSVSTGWVSMANVGAILALVEVGVLGGSATVSASINQATSNAGANSKAVTGKSITAISTNNQCAMINVSNDELDSNGGFTFVQLTLTVATAASLVGARIFGCKPRNYPASLQNDASVVQLVN